ncbi:MAG: hypothetical protein SPJ59_06980 [Peptoniphilaceae bacterium]|nr:hypothetical protein [Peptoniphilaceae bacterium]
MSTGNATMDYDMAQVRYDEGMDAISTKEAQSERLTDFIKALKKQDGLSANLMAVFGENMVEHVTVSKEIAITFRNDIETGVINIQVGKTLGYGRVFFLYGEKHTEKNRKKFDAIHRARYN